MMGIVSAAIALGAIALIGFLWTPDKARSTLEARYLKPSDTLVTVAGTRIRVRDTGSKDASLTPVIMIHGFGSSLETWEAWAASLDDNRRIIRFDLPGSGLSDPDATENYTDARTMRLLLSLMDALGLERADIIGNSIGGRIAWRFAAQHPDRVRKLVLVSPDGFASPGFDYGKTAEVPAIMSAMRWTLPKPMLKANLDPSYGDPARLSADTVTRYHDLMLGPGSRGALLARMQQTVLVDPKTILPNIEAPTLLLWGEKDALIPISNAQDYLELLPNATLLALPGLGHVPFEEAPEATFVPLHAFLDKG